MSDAVSQLADKAAIRDLIYTYCRAVDRLDVPLGHSIWHEDGVADYGAFYQGDGRGVIDAICKSHENLDSHSHQVSNILIRLEGIRAWSESYVTGTMRRKADGKVFQIGIWARYLDAWEKRGGRWGLVKREVMHDHDEVREVTPAGQPGRATRGPDDPSYAYLPGAKP